MLWTACIVIIQSMNQAVRNNVLLLFAKLPEVGKVKTRLSILKDGMFTSEDACLLFEAMLLDVVETSLRAFAELSNDNHGEEGVLDEYCLVVSTTPTDNVPAMEMLLDDSLGDLLESNPGLKAYPIKVIGDAGVDFDEHYNDAFDQAWEMGADIILSMGADMPALTAEDIVRGFEILHEHPDSIAISPDQEMGVSIIGWTRDVDFDHDGVFYNPTGLTVLPAYIEKARTSALPIRYLPPVPDVDTIADLAHNVTLIQALMYAAECGTEPSAPHRTAKMLEVLGIDEVRIAPNELRDSRTEIDQ